MSVLKEEEEKILKNESQIILQNDEERGRYKKLINREFQHAKVYDFNFLTEVGHDRDFIKPSGTLVGLSFPISLKKVLIFSQ
uniref:Uncharacterized protein n=1 Tax=Arundo donax TaxID=35708 RepID=A0A0A9CII2_ARUDO